RLRGRSRLTRMRAALAAPPLPEVVSRGAVSSRTHIAITDESGRVKSKKGAKRASDATRSQQQQPRTQQPGPDRRKKEVRGVRTPA
ncbi:hypothetical protein K7G98_30900, partial [Saccharothrix sp. MB29]|nr:hypothetical protein [Saccharothrix sp. MB29]